jgi:hypothetical protein
MTLLHRKTPRVKHHARCAGLRAVIGVTLFAATGAAPSHAGASPATHTAQPVVHVAAAAATDRH